MQRLKKWLTEPTIAAVVLRLAIVLAAALAAGADPVVALCAGLAGEAGLVNRP